MKYYMVTSVKITNVQYEGIKTLHLLSQRPETTGCGIYLQAMLREAKAGEHHLWMLAAVTRRMPGKHKIVTSCHGSDLRQFQNCPTIGRRVVDLSAIQQTLSVFSWPAVFDRIQGLYSHVLHDAEDSNG